MKDQVKHKGQASDLDKIKETLDIKEQYLENAHGNPKSLDLITQS